MNRIFASYLALSLGLSLSIAPTVRAQTNTDPHREVARIGEGEESGGMAGQPQPDAKLPRFSGNISGGVPEDRTHGVNAPGTLIGPSPENGQPDPRFAGGSQFAGAQQVGGTTSDINEGLPAASKYNGGHNSGGASGGTGGGASGTEVNAGGNARLNEGGSQKSSGTSDIGRETRGASPFAIGAGVVILGAFLFAVLRRVGR